MMWLLFQINQPTTNLVLLYKENKFLDISSTLANCKNLAQTHHYQNMAGMDVPMYSANPFIFHNMSSTPVIV